MKCLYSNFLDGKKIYLSKKLHIVMMYGDNKTIYAHNNNTGI